MADYLNPDFRTRTTSTIEHSAVFVGSALKFSEPSISAFADAFPSFRTVRVPTLADLHLFMKTHDDVAMVIFGQSFWNILTADCETLGLVGGVPRIVLAYSDPHIPLRVMRARKAAPELPFVGFLPMQRNLDMWLAIVALLLSGENYLPPELFHMIDVAAPEPADADRQILEGNIGLPVMTGEGAKPLTDRETEVLSMVAMGKQNKIIADDLGVSEHTVKLHIHHVIRKLGVNNRTAASAWYHSQSAPGDSSLRPGNG